MVRVGFDHRYRPPLRHPTLARHLNAIIVP
ncbi:hypothetical protein FHY02_000284 [Sphingomonas sp. BK069]|nr:hypothetical protein [Sphingomonas sp. BK069]MBB3474559.1 hypothetical protein [Sphingomonas sp. BK345]